MVHRRGSKYGVVTSRTLRKTAYFTKRREFYNGQFTVDKYVELGRGQHFTISQKFKEVLQDGLEVCEHTSLSFTETPSYSLNKRKRWQLPQLLKEAIMEGETEELNFRVSLIERAPRANSDPKDAMNCMYGGNQPDCLSVVRSKCQKGDFKPRAKYSFETDLLGDRKRDWGSIQHIVKEDEPSDQQLPELTFEVCYARSKTTYPSFTPLHNVRIQAQRKHERIQNSKKKEKIHKHQRLYIDDDRLNTILPEFDIVNDDQRTVNIDELKEEDLPPDRASSSCLGDFLSSDSKPKSPQRRKKRKLTKVSSKAGQNVLSNASKKKNVILDPTIKFEEKNTDLSEPYSPSSDSGYSDDSNTAFSFDSADLTTIWRRVALDPPSLDELTMARTFGDSLLDYAESEPYCAAINLCRVDENSSQDGKSDEVVLLIQRLSVTGHIANCRFRVCDLRGDKVKEFSVDTSMVSLDEQRVYTLAEFVEIIKRSLQSLLRPNETGRMKSRKPKELIRLETVSNYLGWQYDSKEEDHILNDVKHQEEISSARSFNSYQPCRLTPPETCEICFDDIVHPEGSMPAATALRVCSHWFCGACWQQHVSSRTQQGDVNMKCPAFECDTPVDTTTLLALLPDSFLPLYSRLQKSRLLSSQKMWEWCQNPLCSRMVRVENTKPPGSGDDQKNVIHCECGFSWCQGCKEAVHWPATCAQAAEYRDYVDNKGVDKGESRITEVEVKRCPQCNYPVEKNGGCMHMICCFCKYEYCWECLSSWSNHFDNWEDCQNIPTVSISLSGKKRMSVEMYLLAATEKRKERATATNVTTLSENVAMKVYYRYLKASNKHLPEINPCFVSAIKKLYSPTWIASDEDIQKFEEILRLCSSGSHLFNEINFVLEYLNVLIATGRTKQLRSRNSGWKDTMDKLGFISLRLHYILTGEGNLKYPEFTASLQRLIQTGQQRLKEVVRALPRVYKLLATKNNTRPRPIKAS